MIANSFSIDFYGLIIMILWISYLLVISGISQGLVVRIGTYSAPELLPRPPDNVQLGDKGDENSRSESRDDSFRVQETYPMNDGHGYDGRVNYKTDENGSRAINETNEPFVGNQNPGDVSIYSESGAQEVKKSQMFTELPQHPGRFGTKVRLGIYNTSEIHRVAVVEI